MKEVVFFSQFQREIFSTPVMARCSKFENSRIDIGRAADVVFVGVAFEVRRCFAAARVQKTPTSACDKPWRHLGRLRLRQAISSRFLPGHTNFCTRRPHWIVSIERPRFHAGSRQNVSRSPIDGSIVAPGVTRREPSRQPRDHLCMRPQWPAHPP